MSEKKKVEDTDDLVQNTIEGLKDFLDTHEDFNCISSLILIHYYNKETKGEKYKFIGNISDEDFIEFFYNFFKENKHLWNTLFHSMMVHQIKTMQQGFDNMQNPQMDDLCKLVKF